jgi:hypothetical protein
MDTALTCLKCGATDIQAVGAGQYRCSQCNTLLGLFGAGAAQCPHCRNAVLSEAAFCHMCGAALQRLAVLNPCQACGQQVPGGSLFCPYCGAGIAQPELAESVSTWGDSSAPVTGRYRESDGCPSCGRTIGPTAPVCPYCRVNVEAFIASLRQQTLPRLEQYEQTEQETRRRERSQWERQELEAAATWRMILLLGILILMMGGSLAVLVVISRAQSAELAVPSLLLPTWILALLGLGVIFFLLMRRWSGK